VSTETNVQPPATIPDTIRGTIPGTIPDTIPATIFDTVPPTSADDVAGRSRDFNRLWLGQSISAFGTQVTTLALPLTAVLYLHASATQIGLLGAARELPVLGLMLFFGVVVDRVRRRPLMIGADLGRAVAIGAIPLLAWLGFLQMPVLYLVAFAVGCLAVIFSLAYQAYLPTLLGPDRLLSGNSRLQSTQSLSDVAGPGLAGFLVQLVRAPFALLADALSFLVSAWSIAVIRTPEPMVERDPAAGDGSQVRRVFTDIYDGLRFTVTHALLRSIAGAAAVFNVFATIMLTIFVVYAARVSHMSAGEIGVVFAGFGIGGLLAAALLDRALGRVGPGRLLLSGYAVGAAAIVSLPFVGGTFLDGSFLGGAAVTRTIIFAVVFFVAGCSIVAANIVEMTIRQAATPNAVQGRVGAGFGFLIGALMPIAAIVAGVLGDHIGLRATLFVASAGVPFSLPWIVFSKLRHIESLDNLDPN
jgi:MFS family permease